MKSPIVSVIICTYNRSHFLQDALPSALCQDYDDYEVIVVDDGSTDETRQLVGKFSEKRIRYHYQDNAGLAAARNTGIGLARGKYVTFLDDDDLYLPHKLTTQISFMEEHPPISWTAVGYEVADLHGNNYGQRRSWLKHPDLNLETWLFWCPTIPDAVMVKREWIERVGGFDERIRGPEDWDLWLRLAGAGCAMAWIPEIAVIYRVHLSSLSRNTAVVHAAEGGYLAVLDKFFAEHNNNVEIGMKKSAAYAHAYLKRAAANYRDGQFEEARRSTIQAIELNPKLLDNNGLKLLDFILAHVTQPLTPDPMGYARSVADNLPAQYWSPREKEKLVMGRSVAALFFSAAKEKRWKSVQQAFLMLVKYDATWLKNRGVWSILGRSILQRIRNR